MDSRLWFNIFRLATILAGMGLLTTFCVGGVEPTGKLLVALMVLLGVWVALWPVWDAWDGRKQ